MIPDLRAFLATPYLSLVLQGDKDPQVRQVSRVWTDWMECRGYQAPRETKETEDNEETLDEGDSGAKKASVEHLASRDRVGSPEKRDRLVHRAGLAEKVMEKLFPAHQVHPVRLALSVLLASQAPWDPLAPLVQRDLRDPEGIKVTEEAKAFQAMTEPKVSPDGLGSPVRRARKVQVGSRASLVSSESLVLLAFQDQRAPWVPRDLRASRVMLVPVESQAFQVNRLLQATLARRVPKERRAAGVKRAHRGHLALRGHKDLRVTQDS